MSSAAESGASSQGGPGPVTADPNGMGDNPVAGIDALMPRKTFQDEPMPKLEALEVDVDEVDDNFDAVETLDSPPPESEGESIVREALEKILERVQFEAADFEEKSRKESKINLCETIENLDCENGSNIEDNVHSGSRISLQLTPVPPPEDDSDEEPPITPKANHTENENETRNRELLRTPQPPEPLKVGENLMAEEEGASVDEESTLEDNGSTEDETADMDDYMYNAEREAHEIFIASRDFPRTELGALPEDARITLRDVVKHIQQAEARHEQIVSEPLLIAKVLDISSHSYGDLVESVAQFKCNSSNLYEQPIDFNMLRNFLTLFGPVQVAIAKASNSLLDRMGLLDTAFWGRMPRSVASDILSRERPGSFLLRWSTTRNWTKLIISYVSEKQQLRHCGLSNAATAGFLVRRSEQQGEETRAFPSIRAFRQASLHSLRFPLHSQYAKKWNDSFRASLSLSQGALDMLSVNWNEGDLLHDYYAKPANDNSTNQYECARSCSERTPRNDNVFIVCDYCGFSSSPPDSPDSSSSILNDGSSADPHPALTNPDELDYLLHKGAERFRTGNPKEAEEIFRDVLSRAARNVDYQIDYQSECPTSRSTTNLVYNGLLQHDSAAAWCKCVACSSLRAKARALGNLGHTYLDQKKIVEAVELYEESLPILRQMGMWKQEPIVLASLKECAFMKKDASLAGRFGIEFMGTVTQAKDRTAIFQRLEDIGALKASGCLPRDDVLDILAQGDAVLQHDKFPEQALVNYIRGVHLARCLQSDLLEVNALIRVGCCMYMMNRLRAAIMYLERAVLLLRANNAAQENRHVGRQRVELHNLALAFVKQATSKAGWASAN